MANNDRVADVYHRRQQSAELQEACRHRVHWICAQVRGRRVLDVGCSQGIAALILGREGHEVVGLDIEEDPVRDAQRSLSREPTLVQERVRFLVEDVFAAEFAAGSFDSVVLGEILEHLANPERLLERVSDWLIEGGQLVVTVPLGYHPHHDHKRSFYPGSLIELLSSRFAIRTVELLSARFLGAVADRPPAGQEPPLPDTAQLLAWERMTYDVIEQASRRAHAARQVWKQEREKLAQKIVDQISKCRAAQEVADERAEAITELKTALSIAEEQVALARAEVSSLRRALTSAESIAREVPVLRTQTARLKQALDKEQVRRRKTDARAERLEARIQYLKAELALRAQEVRYRLGDALVRAARPSADTLKLPGRMLALFFEGLRRRRERAAAESACQAAEPRSPAAAVAGPPANPAGTTWPTVVGDGRGPGSGHPTASAPSAFFDGIPTLSEPFCSAPPALRRCPNLKVAAVTDEFSWRAWQYEADLYTFTPKTWREVLEERRPDLLLIESTWKGVGETWCFQVRDLGRRRDVVSHYAIPDLVAWCRERRIPTVFYNKEDPPNFDVFIDAAGHFDHVFTSDANCIAAYKERLGHERVYALPFAAQPRIHNPVMTGMRTGSVCFAGTWYTHRHPGRQSDAQVILWPALDYDLHIFDRMAHSDNENYRWPEAFWPAIRGTLPYSQMLAAYKRYKAFLNINSVADSPTMFARRVFELLACGTPVISAYSRGIEEVLGTDVVLMSGSEAKTRELLERVLNDDEYRERLSLLGQRRVFSAHTYAHRFQTILSKTGLDAGDMAPSPIHWVAAVSSPEKAQAAWESFRRQQCAAKRLVLCALDSAVAEAAARIAADDPAVRIVTDAQARSWGHVLTKALLHCRTGWVAALNPDDVYGPHYLQDYQHVWLYCTEPGLGKAAYYQSDRRHPLRVIQRGKDCRVVGEVWPWTLCLPVATVLKTDAKLASAKSAWHFWNQVMRGLGRVYSSDRFNYIRIADGSQCAARAVAQMRAQPVETQMAVV